MRTIQEINDSDHLSLENRQHGHFLRNSESDLMDEQRLFRAVSDSAKFFESGDYYELFELWHGEHKAGIEIRSEQVKEGVKKTINNEIFRADNDQKSEEIEGDMRQFLRCCKHRGKDMDHYTEIWEALLNIEDTFPFVKAFKRLLTLMWV